MAPRTCFWNKKGTSSNNASEPLSYENEMTKPSAGNCYSYFRDICLITLWIQGLVARQCTADTCSRAHSLSDV